MGTALIEPGTMGPGATNKHEGANVKGQKGSGNYPGMTERLRLSRNVFEQGSEDPWPNSADFGAWSQNPQRLSTKGPL